MAEVGKWINNIGEVFLSKGKECFWMLPSDLFFSETLRITSPWFSHEDETWRFVKTVSIHRNPVNDSCFVSLYLWKKSRLHPSNHDYTLNVYLKTNTGMRILSTQSAKYYSDLGFEYLRCFSTHKKKDWTCCGLVKLFFVLQKQEAGLYFHPTVRDEDNDKDIIRIGDKTVSEDEIISYEGNCETESTVFADRGIKILAENLKQIFLDGRMSDAVLNVDGREFNVHKAILVARSPVFESMFQHDMAEKNNNAVDIPDCNAESFEVFLHYLYTGSAETISTVNVYDVYYAADKYHVDDLKEKCVSFMMNIITVETFCYIIAFSLRHGESKLQQVATDFFSQNMKKIIKTVEWQKYLDENSTQANELLIKALDA